MERKNLIEKDSSTQNELGTAKAFNLSDLRKEIVNPDFHKINLYDYEKSLGENFQDGASKKYMLIEISSDGASVFGHTIATPQCKIVADMSEIDKYGTLENFVVDYDSIFGTRFTSFMKYNSKFFTCDERVIFEALLIKSKAFNYRPFYWSKTVIFQETGIKKDRATRILKRFVDLGIITSNLVRASIEGRPVQVTKYDIIGEKVIELLPEIFKGREDECNMEKEVKKYLKPLNTRRSLSRILQ